jgi:hypothetical protein
MFLLIDVLALFTVIRMRAENYVLLEKKLILKIEQLDKDYNPQIFLH